MVAGIDSGPAADLVRRSFDPDEINAVVNDPGVLRMAAVQGVDRIDVTSILAATFDDGRLKNYALVADGGNILFLWHDLNTYEVHTNFLKPDRAKQSQNGPHIRNVCLAAYRWMFTRTDCTVLLTKIPHHNRAALIFSPLVGWTHEFTRKACWPTTDGELVDMTFSSLRYDDWIRKTPDLIRVGRQFHDKLSAEFIRHGHEEKPHPDEDCHDLHVGACAEMILAGQLDKAVCLYNRWASFAGYEPMKLVSHTPAVLDIGTALLQVTGDGFKVILVR